ncbi:MAG: hypothetical protein RLZZ292_309 [Bacteroidota bacterium]
MPLIINNVVIRGDNNPSTLINYTIRLNYLADNIFSNLQARHTNGQALSVDEQALLDYFKATPRSFEAADSIHLQVFQNDFSSSTSNQHIYVEHGIAISANNVQGVITGTITVPSTLAAGTHTYSLRLYFHRASVQNPPNNGPSLPFGTTTVIPTLGTLFQFPIYSVHVPFPDQVSSVNIQQPVSVNFPQSVNVNANVQLNRNSPPPTADQQLWQEIQNPNRFDFVTQSGGQIGYQNAMNAIPGVLAGSTPTRGLPNPSSGLPNSVVPNYEELKIGTEAYVRRTLNITGAGGYFGSASAGAGTLPYYTQIQNAVNGLLPPHTRLRNFGFLNMELIWSYWMEQGMLVQTMNVISLRYQNMKRSRGIEVLGRFDTAPLTPISDLLWGYLQDEQFRTNLTRRVYEYDHAYGLTLSGTAVPQVRSVDSRSKFMGAFHTLLNKVSIYFRDSDDTTRIADAFPLLSHLRETHILLAEGNHNAYANLMLTSRIEMLTQQYILARPEMIPFLGGRPMVPFQQPWMPIVDTMKNIQEGWDNTSIINFFDLADCGERILLSIRYGNWNGQMIAAHAATWALAFRNEIQRYIQAYQTVTGVDLSGDTLSVRNGDQAVQPSILIRSRMMKARTAQGQRQGQRASMGRY